MIVRSTLDEVWEVAFLREDGIGLQLVHSSDLAGRLATTFEALGGVVLAVTRIA